MKKSKKSKAKVLSDLHVGWETKPLEQIAKESNVVIAVAREIGRFSTMIGNLFSAIYIADKVSNGKDTIRESRAVIDISETVSGIALIMNNTYGIPQKLAMDMILTAFTSDLERVTLKNDIKFVPQSEDSDVNLPDVVIENLADLPDEVRQALKEALQKTESL